ncbi:hypothetical protein X798_03248 [Onchocerca flexuosa]|uniref:Uncharacterized protein n=1 Tax=Onchocerca flexuosa TaxID=387005 RepID=A0A238BYI7_9BILA|nr:hypothetical protein X798_03248 [Onchocerca flexuosa]
MNAQKFRNGLDRYPTSLPYLSMQMKKNSEWKGGEKKIARMHDRMMPPVLRCDGASYTVAVSSANVTS